MLVRAWIDLGISTRYGKTGLRLMEPPFDHYLAGLIL